MTPEEIKRFDLIESCLLDIFAEIKDQEDVGRLFTPNQMSFSKEKELIFEFIDLAGEFGLAYEYMGGMLELYPFKMSGPAVVKLLDVGLLWGYKSNLPKDDLFNRQNFSSKPGEMTGAIKRPDNMLPEEIKIFHLIKLRTGQEYKPIGSKMLLFVDSIRS
jgi:hypothetical protein